MISGPGSCAGRRSGRTCVQVGDVMVTSRRKPILTVIEDTGPGVHDTLVAACDHHLYEQQLGIKPEVRHTVRRLRRVAAHLRSVQNLCSCHPYQQAECTSCK